MFFFSSFLSFSPSASSFFVSFILQPLFFSPFNLFQFSSSPHRFFFLPPIRFCPFLTPPLVYLFFFSTLTFYFLQLFTFSTFSFRPHPLFSPLYLSFFFRYPIFYFSSPLLYFFIFSPCLRHFFYFPLLSLAFLFLTFFFSSFIFSSITFSLFFVLNGFFHISLYHVLFSFSTCSYVPSLLLSVLFSIPYALTSSASYFFFLLPTFSLKFAHFNYSFNN